MNENKPNGDRQDNELDLSNMINEYEEDTDLRRKIELMKQEKEQVRKVVEDSADTLPVTPQKEARNTIPDFHSTYSEDDLGKTRVLPSQNQEDNDKTLVIMDNQRAKIYDTSQLPKEEEESIFVYDNRQVDAEEITEEDIKEFLGEEEEPKKKRNPMDPNKKNKIITYVIAGCLGLVLILGVGFGVKALIDNGKGEPTEEPSDKPTEKPTEKDPTTNTEPDKPTTDNSIRIAEIKGEIKGYEANLATLNTSLSTAQAAYDGAKANADKIADQIAPIQTKVDNELTGALNKTKQDYTDLEDRMKNGDKTVTQAQLDAAKTAAEVAEKAWSTEVEKIQKLKDEKYPYDSTMKEKDAEITSINTQIKDINTKIKDLNNELSSLQ